MTTPCTLCGPSFTPVLAESEHWEVQLNYNQNLLGKLLIVLKRHEEQVARLSAAEWVELHTQVQRTTERLRSASAFAPDHFNYAFLQNQDRHVHLHVNSALCGTPRSLRRGLRRPGLS